MVRLVTQLDGSGTASFDCGPATTAMAADRASIGKLRPTIRLVRARMGVPSGPTDPWDWKRALDAFDGAMRRDGLRPIPSRLVDGGDQTDLHDLLVEKRRAVLLAIDYGTVARLAPLVEHELPRQPRHPRERWWERDGRAEARVFDPLADGRTIGAKRMVRGPRWWPWLATVSSSRGSRPTGGRPPRAGAGRRGPAAPARGALPLLQRPQGSEPAALIMEDPVATSACVDTGPTAPALSLGVRRGPELLETATTRSPWEEYLGDAQ
jgi:hypothetical protein